MFDLAVLDSIEAQGLALHALLLEEARATVTTDTAALFMAEAA